MRKHLFVTLLLTCGLPFSGQMFASANPEPQQAAQAQTITGTVLDENNEPVIGASVTLKGQTQGVSTDVDGKFSIRAAQGAMLRVSFVGYEPVEARAANGMTVRLNTTSSLLDEIVVVGYGTQKKINLTGAVSTVDVSKTLDSRPIQDVGKALQGAVPGLTITTATGSLEDSPTINIRGVGTLSNGHTSAPLIIVDGVPAQDLTFLNPEDIESISVLKDAASSAIYGSRAAFGVILVTTKEGNSRDRVSVSYSNNFGWSGSTVLPEFNDAVTDIEIALLDANPGNEGGLFDQSFSALLPYAKLWQEQHHGKRYTRTVEAKPYVDDNNVGDYRLLPNGGWVRYADWDVAKTVFRNDAFSQKHNVSIDGQSGKTNYRLSFSYDSAEGVLRDNPDRIKRYTANATVGTQIFSWLKAGARFSFSERDFKEPQWYTNVYLNTWRWPSYFNFYAYTVDADGDRTYFRNPSSARLLEPDDNRKTSRFNGQAYFLANITKDIMLQGDFNFFLQNYTRDYMMAPYYMWQTWSPATPMVSQWCQYPQATSRVYNQYAKRNTWAANIYATWDKTFNEKHNVKVMLGWTAEREHYEMFSALRYGVLDTNLPNLNLTNGETMQITASAYNRATTGFFARVNYNYNDIWLLEANGRYDGSSSFPANDQWAFFPSASAGYRFSNESYFEELRNTWFNNGKVRFSYGQVGNEAVGSNMFISTVGQIAPGNVNWVNGSGQKIQEFASPTAVSSKLTWERIETYDVGLDLGFLNNTLNFGFDWYQRNNHDMLAPGVTLPSVYGAATPYQNAGSLRTRGWELSITYNNRFNDVNFWASFMLSDSNTKITKWNNPSGLIYNYAPGANNYTEGFNFGDIYGFETDRYFTVDDFVWNTADGKWQPGAVRTGYAAGVADQSGLESGSFAYGPGDIKFKDVDGDGTISFGKLTKDDHGDLKKIGNALPHFEYSFRFGAEWKGFDADIFFQGVGKQQMWATGSTIIPAAIGNSAGAGTFTNQTDFNTATAGTGGALLDYSVRQDADYPRPYSGGGEAAGRGNQTQLGYGQYNYYPQTKYLLSLAYLRVKNLTIGYTLPRDITRKALIQKARIYFSADNLGFIYNGAGKYQLDPEMATTAGNTSVGINGGAGSFGRVTPQRQTYSFGVQVTF